MVALSVMGSAILLFSCGRSKSDTDSANNETLMTERSEHLTILMSENGRRSYHFKTPLLEGYTLASDPYREFRKGIHITTYQDDSLATVNATLVANYAIFYEERELWEAKGDVVVEKADGTKLYTQQLYWNSKTGRIYSNVDSKIVKGTDVFMGEGFESDEELKEWRFRRMSGKMFVNMEPTENPDSLAVKPLEPSDSESRPSKVEVTDTKNGKPQSETMESPKERERRRTEEPHVSPVQDGTPPIMRKASETQRISLDKQRTHRTLNNTEEHIVKGSGKMHMQRVEAAMNVDEKIEE